LIAPGFSKTIPYSTSFDTTKNTQACRIYHLGVASKDITHCSHGAISGGGACGDYAPNVCGFIGSICGFGSAAHQFADQATCQTALTGLTAGPTTDTANNTFECRFYHASVAASYAPGGINANQTGANASVVLHCSHVLKTATVGGCGYTSMTTPTPAAGTNSAASISLGVSMMAVAASVFF